MISNRSRASRSPRSKNLFESVFVFCARFMRLLAYFLVILVMGLYGSSGFLYPFFVKAEILVSHVLPLVLRGFASIPTMFNGAFRGDIALLALACFLLDWLFVRLAHLVRS